MASDHYTKPADVATGDLITAADYNEQGTNTLAAFGTLETEVDGKAANTHEHGEAGTTLVISVASEAALDAEVPTVDGVIATTYDQGNKYTWDLVNSIWRVHDGNKYITGELPAESGGTYDYTIPTGTEVYDITTATFKKWNNTTWVAALEIVEDTSPQLGGDLDLNGKNIDFPTTANISDCLDEDNMATDSATMLATQQSIKAYVDGVGTDPYNFISDTSTVLFYQTTVPTGWTIDATKNDYMLRVVSATGGGSAGTNGVSQFSAHTHSDTLEAPLHTHSHWHDVGQGNGAEGGSEGGSPGATTTDNTAASATALTGAVTASSGFAPKYINVVIGTKNA